MKKYLILLFFIFFCINVQAQTYLFGKVINENKLALPATTVINISTDQKTISDSDGNFMIRASEGDQIRFIRNNYNRLSLFLTKNSFDTSINIELIYDAQEIEEVTIAFAPSGILKDDLKRLPKNEKMERLRKDIAQSLRFKPTEVMPKLSIPSAFAPRNFSEGQMNMAGVAALIGKLISNKPKITEPSFTESKDFLIKLKANINVQFYMQYGITDEQLDQFLADANEDLKLARRFRKDFSIKAIEILLREKFLNYNFKK